MVCRRRYLAIAFATCAIGLLLVHSLSMGFASDTQIYRSTTTNVENSASADYFTAGLFVYHGENAAESILDFNNADFDAVATAAFNTGEVPYTKDGSVYSVVNGSTNTAIDNLYVAVISTNQHTMTSGSFSLTYEVVGITESSFTGNANLTWGRTSPAIEAGKAYRLHLGLSNLNYSDTNFPSMTIDVIITITDNNSASYMSVGNSVQFRVATPMDQFKEELDDANEDLGDQGMQFEANNDDPPGVYIQNTGSNTHSIADSDSGFSSIDVDVAIPPGVKVCVYVTIRPSVSFFLSSDVTVSVVKKTSSGDKSYGQVTLESKGLRNLKEYIYLNGSSSALDHGTSKPTQSSRYFQCNEGEEIAISFEGDQGWSLLSGTITVTAKLVPYNN